MRVSSKCLVSLIFWFWVGCNPFQSSENGCWDWRGCREDRTLGLEAVFVGDVGELHCVAFGVGVLVLSLGYLGFLFRLTSVLQEALFFGADAVTGFVTGKFGSVLVLSLQIYLI